MEAGTVVKCLSLTLFICRIVLWNNLYPCLKAGAVVKFLSLTSFICRTVLSSNSYPCLQAWAVVRLLSLTLFVCRTVLWNNSYPCLQAGAVVRFLSLTLFICRTVLWNNSYPCPKAGAVVKFFVSHMQEHSRISLMNCRGRRMLPPGLLLDVVGDITAQFSSVQSLDRLDCRGDMRDEWNSLPFDIRSINPLLYSCSENTSFQELLRIQLNPATALFTFSFMHCIYSHHL